MPLSSFPGQLPTWAAGGGEWSLPAVILVVRLGRTRRRDIHTAMERLGHVGAPVLGAVLNDVPRRLTGHRDYYGDYYYRAG